MSDQWCTIESDPGVFTELLDDLGVRGIELIELYDINSIHTAINNSNSMLGLVFLFKWDAELYADKQSRAILEPDDELNDTVYFAKQVINNACGTQALINILMNIDTNKYNNTIQLGDELMNFKSFTQSLDPDSRGYTIGSSDLIRLSHNSYARPEPFILDSNDKNDTRDKEDAFHFISYVPINGLLYELDGLQSGPILCGAYDIDDTNSWIELAQQSIHERINKYTNKEIRFNLMAMIQSNTTHLQAQINDIQSTIQSIQDKITGMNNPDGMNTDDISPNDMNELTNLLSTQQSQLIELNQQLNDEQHKHQQYKIENIRRRHNYVPLIFNLANELCKRHQLQLLVDTAQQKVKERNDRNQSRRDAAKQAPAAPRKTSDTKMNYSDNNNINHTTTAK